MRVGREAVAGAVRVLLAESVKLQLVESPFEEGARVDAGRGMALIVDVVATTRVVLAAEEMIEADFIQAGR